MLEKPSRTCAFLIHGFNVWDGGAATVGTLAPFFAAQGVTPVSIDYGHFGLIQTKLFNTRVAEKVNAAIRAASVSYDHVLLVGHSNGCAVIDAASRRPGFKAAGFIYINPALRRDRTLAPGVDFLHVWHSPSDWVVRIARRLPFARNWGAMGAHGYQGVPDPRIENFNKEVGYPVSSSGHSDVFAYDKRPTFGPIIVGNAVDALVTR